MSLIRVGSFVCVLTFALAGTQARAQSSVPYIGCPGDGQTVVAQQEVLRSE